MKHINSPFVHIFGNSLIFANHASTLPVYLQPFLFYPDWFFMAWPADVFAFCIGPHTQAAADVIGSAIFWFVLGLVGAMLGLSRTFTQAISSEWVPFSPQHANVSPLGKLVLFPFGLINAIYLIISRLFLLLLFWHIIIARAIISVLTVGGAVATEFAVVIERLVMFVMLVPAVIYLTWTTIHIILFFL